MSELETIHEIIMNRAVKFLKEHDEMPKIEENLYDRICKLAQARAYSDVWKLLLDNKEFQEKICN